MAKFSFISLAVLVLGFSSMTSYADVKCKASMMGRICYDSNGNELTLSQMQEATKKAEQAAAKKQKQNVAKN